MDLSTFTWLLSAEAQQLLAELGPADLRDAAQLATMSRLRREASVEHAAAVYETARLRERGRSKFRHADTMYFTRDALEQASGEAITGYRSARFGGYSQIADLCCGIGGDTVALARRAKVSAVDYDELRLAMAHENLRAYNLEQHVRLVHADLERTAPPAAEAIFFDPARRIDGRRVFALDAYVPSMQLLHGWLQQTPAIGVKVGPGVADEDLAALPPHEVEFISVDGELKEAVLWFGPLGAPGRRATLLNSNHTNAPPSMFNRQPRQGIQLAEPGTYVYEPDPAVIRAHVVADLGEQLGATQLDETIAYLTSDMAITTPFARCWQVLEWMPFNLKRLRSHLRALDAGAVTVKKRGSPLDTDTLAKQLSGGGTRPLVVVLTRLRSQPIALICVGPIF